MYIDSFLSFLNKVHKKWNIKNITLIVFRKLIFVHYIYDLYDYDLYV